MAGTVTVSHLTRGAVKAIRFSVVADAADASVPETELPRFSGQLVALETVPGETAPTDEFDITLEDANGHDVLEGCGGDVANDASAKVPVVYAATALHPVVAVDDELTFKVANNAVNEAEFEVVLYYLGAPE